MKLFRLELPRRAGKLTKSISIMRQAWFSFAHGDTFFTANAGDFVELHQQWMLRHDNHHGILVIYRENNPVRDMTLQEIAQAIKQIERSGLPLRNSCYNLNFWRGSGH